MKSYWYLNGDGSYERMWDYFRPSMLHNITECVISFILLQNYLCSHSGLALMLCSQLSPLWLLISRGNFSSKKSENVSIMKPWRCYGGVSLSSLAVPSFPWLPALLPLNLVPWNSAGPTRLYGKWQEVMNLNLPRLVTKGTRERLKGNVIYHMFQYTTL